jgi:hypothetical protein
MPRAYVARRVAWQAPRFLEGFAAKAMRPAMLTGRSYRRSRRIGTKRMSPQDREEYPLDWLEILGGQEGTSRQARRFTITRVIVTELHKLHEFILNTDRLGA